MATSCHDAAIGALSAAAAIAPKAAEFELRKLTLPEVGTALARLAPRKVLANMVDAI